MASADEDVIPPFWQTELVRRVHPRLAAEMVLDAQECSSDGRLLIEYLHERGFSADYVRSKGYLGDPFVVAVLPLYHRDMTAVASLSVRRNVDNLDDNQMPARATIVRLSGAAAPVDFSILFVENDRVKEIGPVTFDELAKLGVSGVLKRSGCDGAVKRITKGRGLAPVVLEDMVSDELKLEFLSSSEAHRILSDASLYTDLARLHASVGRESLSCESCCSTSCYACTSCSCGINLGLTAATA